MSLLKLISIHKQCSGILGCMIWVHNFGVCSQLSVGQCMCYSVVCKMHTLHFDIHAKYTHVDLKILSPCMHC